MKRGLVLLSYGVLNRDRVVDVSSVSGLAEEDVPVLPIGGTSPGHGQVASGIDVICELVCLSVSGRGHPVPDAHLRRVERRSTPGGIK